MSVAAIISGEFYKKSCPIMRAALLYQSGVFWRFFLWLWQFHFVMLMIESIIQAKLRAWDDQYKDQIPETEDFMKAERIAIVCIILALFFTAIAPVPAEAAPSPNSILTINNKTAGPVTITLVGPKTYTIVAVAGATTKEVVRGQYKYTYNACGLSKKGSVTAGGGKSKLNITACQMAKIRFMNLSSTTLTLSLTGPQVVRITVPPKSYQDLAVYKGEYQGKGTWCNQTQNLSVKFSGKKVWSFWGC